ncbi:hypothetical protein Moror_17389 [Moniliophthora roreri MCA 2997]|uniref:Uncharacterized protein n=1 Tax=Moniliophthora roreri (strain MCA 2997) TaxID=1381753 RepID=V2XVA6_MONRO|nr:hypothetical protein Moror_17389 [Moniliophthora roreri MCA 2997]
MTPITGLYRHFKNGYFDACGNDNDEKSKLEHGVQSRIRPVILAIIEAEDCSEVRWAQSPRVLELLATKSIDEMKWFMYDFGLSQVVTARSFKLEIDENFAEVRAFEGNMVATSCRFDSGAFRRFWIIL